MLEQGMYRIDADSARLWVLNGKVQVSDGDDQRRLSVEQGMYLRFAAILLPERSVDQPRDVFSTWIKSRQQTIAADNAIAAILRFSPRRNTGSHAWFPMHRLAPLGPIVSGL